MEDRAPSFDSVLLQGRGTTLFRGHRAQATCAIPMFGIASRTSYVRHLRAFFKWAVKNGHMQADPTPVRELNRRAPARTVPEFLNEDQFDHLIRLIESDGILGGTDDNRWLVNAVRFAAGTGLRRGELCNLRWSAVDLSSGFVYVKNEEGRSGAKAFRTKTGSERAVPLVGDALAVVRSLHEARTGEADGYVLTGAKGGQMNADFLTKRFRDYRKKTGLPTVINFHSLRHTFASWWVLRGGDIYRLKEVLGRSDIQTTMIYAHLREEALKTHGGAGAAGASVDQLARLEAENMALRQKLDG